MDQGQFKHGFLTFLQYNRRFQECCFLLGIRANLYKQEPLCEFWEHREQRFLSWTDTPQVRSILEYDIKRICGLCGLAYNRNNSLLIFTCAYYGVWRTTKWLLKQQKEADVKDEHDLPLTTAFMVVRYLASLLSERNDLRVDHITYAFIEEVTKWLKENGWGDYQMEKPAQTATKGEKLKFQMDTSNTLPLKIRALVEQINNGHKENEKERRAREDKRNYLFWRWRRMGMKLLDIAERWDELEDREYPTQEKVVGMALGKYLKECGPLFDDISTLHYYKKLTQRVEKRDAADIILERAYRESVECKEIMLPTEAEIRIK